MNCMAVWKISVYKHCFCKKKRVKICQPQEEKTLCFDSQLGLVGTLMTTGDVHDIFPIDLIHDGRHVGFAIIMQISYTSLRRQTTQVREIKTNILATQMIFFTFTECLSPK